MVISPVISYRDVAINELIDRPDGEKSREQQHIFPGGKDNRNGGLQ